MNAAWDHLLPAMRQAPLSASAASPEVKRKLERLTVRPPEGSPASPNARRVSGRICRFEANEEKIQSATLAFKGNRCRMTLRDEGGEHPVECGNGAWVNAAGYPRSGWTRSGASGSARQRRGAGLEGWPDGKVAACGAWTAEDTYTVKLCYYETPFVQTMTWKFTGDQVTVKRKMNVGFGPTERPTLEGRLA